MKIETTILILFFSITTVKAQVFGTQVMIEEENISLRAWEEENVKNYSGVYFFGESEAESSLHLFIFNDMVCAQLEKGNWTIKNSKIIDWTKSYKNFTNVKIKGNQFYSDQSNGEFVFFEVANKKYKGLKLVNPPVQTGNKGDYEIGSYSKFDEIGNYFNTKTTIISLNYLNKMDKEELKIMRNEIFARYHYEFKTKKLSEYFIKQKWYSGYHQNVDSFLTEIEKENIKRILNIEKNN
ncbi:YARHG domain-containing protein [Tenacibaculum sp. SDUM215027]|uniref:YARHG domain-containing protein n=1 Tax=Tenacibaculum sp. SDUM215027 TaxID=3422596 RepID=UPI003D31F843